MKLDCEAASLKLYYEFRLSGRDFLKLQEKKI